MGRQRKPTIQDMMRLDAIAKHLKVKARFPDARFTTEVTDACMKRVSSIIDQMLPCTGEQIAAGLGEHFQLIFEEVHGLDDVEALENRYLKDMKEIGFAQLRSELDRPGVDALLFERMNAEERDADRWVAVLNLQESQAKAYWNRFHELSHRIAEPPQGILPFRRRHQFEASNPVEALVDAVAAELAFYAPVFRPLVERFAKRGRLDFSVVDAIRESYAPTASLLSTANAVVKYWPRSAAVVTAEFRGRRQAPETDRALRVSLQGLNQHAAKSGLKFIPNMRVPLGTPIHQAYESGMEQAAEEPLGDWSTSDGKCLQAISVFTSARMTKDRVYAVISA